MSIVLGMIAVALGSYGIYHWLGDFFIFLKGLLPFSFICGGLITIAAGIASLKSK